MTHQLTSLLSGLGLNVTIITQTFTDDPIEKSNPSQPRHSLFPFLCFIFLSSLYQHLTYTHGLLTFIIYLFPLNVITC